MSAVLHVSLFVLFCFILKCIPFGAPKSQDFLPSLPDGVCFLLGTGYPSTEKLWRLQTQMMLSQVYSYCPWAWFPWRWRDVLLWGLALCSVTQCVKGLTTRAPKSWESFPCSPFDRYGGPGSSQTFRPPACLINSGVTFCTTAPGLTCLVLFLSEIFAV